MLGTLSEAWKNLLLSAIRKHACSHLGSGKVAERLVLGLMEVWDADDGLLRACVPQRLHCYVGWARSRWRQAACHDLGSLL